MNFKCIRKIFKIKQQITANLSAYSMNALSLESPIGGKDAARNSCLKQKNQKIFNWVCLFFI